MNNHRHHNHNDAALGLVHEALQGRISTQLFTRRAVIMGLSAATVTAVLTACNGGGGGTAGGAGGTYTASTGANKGKEYTLTANYKPGTAKLEVQLGAEKKGPIYPDGYVGPKYREIEKFSDGKTEFTIVAITLLGFDWKTNGFTKFLEDTTGVKINYKPINFSTKEEVQTKFNAMLAAGDLPDAFMLGGDWSGGFNTSQLYAYGSSGVFLGLDELIDKFGPNAREAFEQIPGLRQSITSPDGKIYGYPLVNDCYHCRSAQQRSWINAEWLKKVGMQTPTTTAELETVLQAFKDKNPSGLARAVPMSGQAKDFLLDYLMTGFTYSNSSFGWLAATQGKVELVVTRPDYRKGLVWVADLVKKGLVDKNAFTQDGAALQTMVDGKAGTLVGAANGVVRAAFSQNAAFGTPSTGNYMPLPPLKGPGGTQVSSWKYDLGGFATNLVITTKCKDPAALVRWCDAQLDLFMTLQQTRGEYGKDWDWAPAGTNGINGKQALYTIKPKDAAASNKPGAAYTWSWDEFGVQNKANDVRLGEAVLDPKALGGERELYSIGKEYEKYKQPRDEYVGTLAYDTNDAANVAQLRTNIENYIRQQLALFCTGKTDPASDGDWKKFTDGLNSQQLPQYLQLVQQAYEATPGAKMS